MFSLTEEQNIKDEGTFRNDGILLRFHIDSSPEVTIVFQHVQCLFSPWGAICSAKIPGTFGRHKEKRWTQQRVLVYAMWTHTHTLSLSCTRNQKSRWSTQYVISINSQAAIVLLCVICISFKIKIEISYIKYI